MRYFLPLLAILLGSSTTHAEPESVSKDNSSSHPLADFCRQPIGPCKVNQDCVNLIGAPQDSVCIDLDGPGIGIGPVCVCPRGEWFLECEQEKCFPFPETISGSTCIEASHCINLAFGGGEELVECPHGEGLQYGSCTCKNTTSVYNIGNDTCIVKVDVRGARCDIDAQCHGLGYAECALDRLTGQGQCDCIGGADGSHYDGKICYKLAENVGDECLIPEQCKNLRGDLSAVCRNFSDTVTNKTCQCDANDGFEIENKCWLFIDYDIPCTHAEQCWAYKDFTHCVKEEGAALSYCRCMQGYVDVLNSTNIDCRQNVTVNGGLCEYPVQCFAGMGPYSDCFAGSCRCNDGFGYHNDNGSINKCFPPKCYNQPCTSNGECATCVGANSLCRNTTTTRTCGCVDTAIDSEDGKCYLPKRVGDSCYTQAECTVPIKGHVECDMSSKRCVCEVDYVSDLGGTMCRSGSERVQFSLVFVVVMIAVSKLF